MTVLVKPFTMLLDAQGDVILNLTFIKQLRARSPTP